MNKLVPMFKKKYNIEKLTFITLTDGSSNSNYYINNVVNTEEGLQQSKADTGTPVIKVGKKQYSLGKSFYGNVTQIGEYDIILSNQDKAIPPIVCDWALGQREFIARLKPGYSVSVIGRLSVDTKNLYRYLDESQSMLTILDCKIVNFKQEP